MMHGDGLMTMAQAVGDVPMPRLSFAVGYDFDPYDREDVEEVFETMERHKVEEILALHRELEAKNEEIAQLRAQWAELGTE
ncbi:hypothetical protein CJ179_38580 [Rhodococcus sp. ACS1]|nr:hypothetical protein CJ179_38580 [Rhodococcus sp. ACS1]